MKTDPMKPYTVVHAKHAIPISILFLIVSFLVASFAPTGAWAANGDVNGDNVVNAGDVLLAQRISMGLVMATPEQLSRGDVAPISAPDGVINAGDVVVIQRIAMGLINTYAITASAGANGTISPTGAVSVVSGATATFTITPDTNYHVLAVLADGVSKGTMTSYTFTNVIANHTLSASFEADAADETPPIGSIMINSEADYTNSTTVNLTLSATDSEGSVAQMQFNDDNTTWPSPEPYTTTKSWTFSTGDGAKTVQVKFKDNAGNWSAAFSDSIVLDTIAPTVTITSPATGVTNDDTPLLAYKINNNGSITKAGIRRGADILLDMNGNYAWDGTPGDAQYSFGSGIADAVPVAGDWTGIKTTRIGVYDNGTWYLDLDGNGVWDDGTAGVKNFGGMPGAVPVTGDWNGTGTTKIGVYDGGVWYLDLNGNGTWDDGTAGVKNFGVPGDLPITGDWTGDGRTSIGVVRGNTWFLDINGNGAWDDGIDAAYSFGVPGDLPVIGDWNGSGTSKIGVVRGNTWYLDMNGNGVWDEGIDAVNVFGEPGDVPMTGDWSGTGPVDVKVKVDGGVVSKVSGDSLDALAEGPHTVRVESTDAAGNAGYVEVAFTVDTVVPSITINPLSAPISNNTATISGTVESGVMVTITVNTTATGGLVSYPTPTTWQCTISGLVIGSNIITARATDVAGNSATATMTLDPALVGLWHMDGDWTDASGNNLQGAAYSGATFTTNAMVGSQAGSFNGTSSYVSVPNNAKLSMTAAITVSLWAKSNIAWSSQPGFPALMRKKPDDGSGYYVMSVHPGNRAVNFQIQATQSASVQTGALWPNTWYHFVGTYDGANVKMYVNGALVQTVPATGALYTNSANLEFGKNRSGFVSGNYYSEFFNGLIDEAAIYNRALSAEEISGLYNDVFGRVGLWHMNGDWQDASGHANHGTAYNGAGFSTTARVGSQAGSFDGMGAYVSGPANKFPIGSSPRTISAWIKVGEGTQNRAIFDYGLPGNFTSQSRMALYINESNKATFGNSDVAISGATSLGDGFWHYVAATYDGSAINIVRIYVDGILETSAEVTTPSTLRGGYTIASFLDGGGYFNGLIDEVTIYNYAVSSDEITKYYNQGLGRVGLWHMDGDWNDASGNGNNGTPYSGATFTTSAIVGSQAGSFDGADDYVIVPSSASFNSTAAITVSLWAKSNINWGTQANGAALIRKSDGTFSMYIYSVDKTVNFLILTTQQVIAETNALLPNTWYHFVGTYDGANAKIYVNGSLVQTVQLVGALNASNGNLVIGKDYCFKGLLDDISIYNSALSAEEVRNLYQAVIPPVVTITSPVAGNSNVNTPLLTYQVDEGAVTVKVDGIPVNKTSGDHLDPLTDGTYIIRVESKNVVGTVGFAEVSITVDTAPPAVTIDPVTSPTWTNSQTITGTMSSASTVTLSVSTGAVVGPASYPTSTTWSCTITGLVTGPNIISATAVDEAGNRTTAETSINLYSVNIDDVSASSHLIDVATHENTTIFFTIGAPAQVTLQIIPENQGPFGPPIYQASQSCSAQGAYLFTWDGKDSMGQIVPDEAYLYILLATDGTNTFTYSPTAQTGSGAVSCSQGTVFDPYRNVPLQMTYTLGQPARINLDALNVVNSLTSLLLNAPYYTGSYSYNWSGVDGQNYIQKSGRASCSATSLSENVIITHGMTPVISSIMADPYEINLSYGQYAKISYTLSTYVDATVTVQLISPSKSVYTVSSGPQSAGQHSVTFPDWITSAGQLPIIEEGFYVIVIQATCPGGNYTANPTFAISRLQHGQRVD